MLVQIKSLNGSILFSYDCEDNSLRKTLEKAVQEKKDLTGADLTGADLTSADLTDAHLRGADLIGADLIGADLHGANLHGAYLRGADLTGAYLTDAYLTGAYLRGADLTGAYLTDAYLTGAYLRGADLSGANLRGVKGIPVDWANLCFRDMLFVFSYLKNELPFLRKALVEGRVDGTQYEGDCACLIGSLAKSLPKNGDNVEKVCSMIPYYDKGLHNFGEQWFFQIHEGDTPDNSDFSRKAVELIDSVLKKEGGE